jgi:hypothetical protein
MHDEMRPMVPTTVEDNNEGSMARAELYRAAKYSMKLFQMIQENQDLEGWVQSKITKAADYLDSVYHYMEYQTKFGDGSNASEINDITSDAESDMEKSDVVSDMDDEADFDDEKKIDENASYEDKLKALLEGKVKRACDVKETSKVKGKKAEDKKEKDLDEAKIEKSGVRASDKKKGKVDKSERKQYFVKLEKDGKTKGMTIVADEGESQGDVRDRAARDAKSGGWTVASIRVKDDIDESAEVIAEKATSKKQQKFMGMVHAAKKGEKPASKEVAKAAKGMSKKDAEDFASTKHKGLPEKKEKKDESLVRSIVKKVVAEKKAKPDFLDVDKDGDKKEPMKKAVADKKGDAPKKGVNPFAKKEAVNESTELARMKQFLTRLNG